MAVLPFKLSPFEPALTGPLLYALTRGPPDLRERMIQSISSFKYAPQLSTTITSLKWLFALGVAGKLTSLLNKWAFNNWKFSTGGAAYDWPKEVVVVTGGSSGIGLRVTEILTAAGATVAILDLQAPLHKVNGKVHFYQCDLRSHDEIDAVAAKVKAELGAPSVLVNNAGLGTTGSIMEASDKALDTIFKVNLICHWWTVQAFLPGMIEQRKGHVVTVASMASFVAVAGIVDYCATKAGALAFHEGLTQELRHRFKAPFIKTTSVHPSWVNTPLLSKDVGEEAVKKAGAMNVDMVAKPLCDNILNNRGGQLIVPSKLAQVSGIRGWASWFQEFVRDHAANIPGR